MLTCLNGDISGARVSDFTTTINNYNLVLGAPSMGLRHYY